MNKLDQRIQRIKDVEKEYDAVKSGLRLLAERLRADPGWGAPEGWSARDAANSSENLETTYVIRIYAEFESGLRDVWKHYFKKKKRTPAERLLVLVATQRVPQDSVDDADEVRRYRNFLVHDEVQGQPVALSLREVTKRLCRYFSNMPRDW